MGCNIKQIKENESSIFGKIIKKTGLTHTAALSRSETLKEILGNRQVFLDNNFEKLNEFTKSVSETNAYFKTEGLYKEYIKGIKQYSGELINGGNLNNVFHKSFDKFSNIEKNKILNLIKRLEDLYGGEGSRYLLYQYSHNAKGSFYMDGISMLAKNSLGSIQTDMYIHLRNYVGEHAIDFKYSDFKKYFSNILNKEVGDLVGEKRAKVLVEDILGEDIKSPFFKNKQIKWLITNLRAASYISKFVINPASNLMFGVNAFIMSTFNYMTKKRGLETIMDSNGFKELRINFNILKGEKVVNAEDMAVLEGNSDSFILKTIDFIVGKTVGKISKGKLTGYVSTYLKGGSQVIPDLILEESIKSMAIARALGKMGINVNNIDDFIKRINEGKISKDIISEISGEALLEYNTFYTRSSLLGLSRDRFSNWISLGFLTHYVNARSAEMIDSIRLLYRDVQTGEYNNYSSFAEYLNKNTELKTLLHGLLNSISFGYYMNVYLGDNGQDEKEKIKAYIMGVNDQISSLKATVPYRLVVNGIFGYPMKYADYMEERGEDMRIVDYAKIGMFGFTSELIRSFFRELKISDMLIGTTGLYNQGFSYDAIMANLQVSFDKAVNGMGRFGAVEGFEKYGLHKVAEYDDTLGYFLMGIDDTNESLREYAKLRTVEGIKQALDNGLISQNISNIMYSNIGKFVTGTIGAFTGDTYMSSEAKMNLYKEELRKDNILKDLYNGKFNVGLLRTDGVYDTNKVDKIFTDLKRYDLSRVNSSIKDDGTGKFNKIFGSKLDQGKEEIFVEQLIKAIGEENYLLKINNGDYGVNERGFQKMLLMAENKVKGSSRVILSYLVNKEYSNTVQQLNYKLSGGKNKSYSDRNLPIDIKNELKVSLINKYYPTGAVFDTDKESWFRLIEMRMNDKYPDIFKIDNNKKKYFNALALVDFISYTEGKKANPDANYIKNIYSVIGKFIKDPKSRIDIANHTMKTIESLNTNKDVTNMLKVGVLAGNMDFVSNLIKDEEFYNNNKNSIDTFLDIMFDTNDKMNKDGSKLIVNDLDSYGKKQYYTNGGYTNYGKRDSSGYPNNKTNKGIYDNFKKNIIPKYKLPGTYRMNRDTGYISHPQFKGYPEIAKTYFKLQYQLKQAYSKQLVTGYVRKYPHDFIGKLKFRDQNRVKIKRIKRKRTIFF